HTGRRKRTSESKRARPWRSIASTACGCTSGKHRGEGAMISISAAVVIFLIFLILTSAITVLREYERGVGFRLGRPIGAKEPGIDRHTEAWGIKVSTVEVKNVDLPQEMQRAIARQAEAERERRAKVINAEGELQASQKLSEAAAVIATQPLAMQLRYLQTLAAIAT